MGLFALTVAAFLLCLLTLLSGCSTVGFFGNEDSPHAFYDRKGLDIPVEDAGRKTTAIKDFDGIANSLNRQAF